MAFAVVETAADVAIIGDFFAFECFVAVTYVVGSVELDVVTLVFATVVAAVALAPVDVIILDYPFVVQIQVHSDLRITKAKIR